MSNYRVQKQRTWKTELPVFDHKDNLINSVKQHATTVVVGETGAGKSTQLPQYLADALLPEPKMNGKRQGCIVCTQPRRVAAVTIAQQVSAEWGGKVGEQVGYSIRFEDRTSADTRIKFVTDGVLLRECMSDRDLRQYKVVILDEAHERSLQTDILMGLLRQIQERRSDLKIVVMSATLQIQVFQNFFKDVHLVSIPGRQFPVKAMYTKEPESDYVDAAMLTCLQIHEEMEDTGGVLVFLPGQDDIESLQALLEENLPNIETKGNDHLHYSTQKFDRNYITNDSEPNPSLTVTVQHNFMIRPLYAALPPDDQVKVFAPAPKGVRKFVLATNIAETSVTITGIKYVIDTGFAKTRFINESTGVEMLKVLPISKFQANQRLGRAGRESAGICYRLYTEPTFMTLREASIPEIQRTNIAQVLLQLKVLGVTSPAAFPFVSPPTKISLRKALELLYLLGAIDDNQQLTEHGRRMAMLPLDPLFSNMLLVSVSLNCVHEALTAVSLLSSESVFVQPYREDQKKEAASAHRRLSSRQGDLPTLLKIYDMWIKAKKDRRWAGQNYLSQRSLSHAESVRSQLSQLLQQQLNIDVTVSCAPEQEPFLRCLATGLMLNIAKRSTTAISTSSVGTGSKHAMDPDSAMGKHEAKRMKMESLVSQTKSMDSSESSIRSSGKYSYSQQSEENRISSSSGFKPNAFMFLKETPAISAASAMDRTAPYRTLRGNQPVHVHPTSIMFSLVHTRKLPEFVVFAELLITSKQYMRHITAIDQSYIQKNSLSNHS